ncbi:condensation domain-containing protein [Nannocystaceae bacterium ST9]
MTLTELLLELGRLGVALDLVEGELKLKAPHGVLTPALLAELRLHKPALIDRLADARPPAVESIDRTRPIPLSPGQERMWFLKRLEAELGCLSAPIAARVLGPFDCEAFAASLDALVARHEILRTRYELHDGVAVQIVDERAASTLVVVDAREFDEARRRAALDQLVAAPAGPSRATLDVRVLEFGDEDRALAFNLRDIALDGWSRSVFIHELAQLYASRRAHRAGRLEPEPELAHLPVQYADWCAWQARWLRGPEAAEQLRWWTETLAGLPRDAGFPPDHPRPAVRRMRARLHPLRFPTATVAALREWTTTQGATLHAALLSAFAIVASRRSGAAEIVVGTPVANREQREVAAVLGSFANNLVLRLPVGDAARPDQLLVRVRDGLRAAMRRQAVPIELVADALGVAREHDRTPLFQVLVALNVATPAVELDGARLTPLNADELLSRFDLAIALEELDGALDGWIEYDTELYEPATIAALADDLVALAHGLPSAASLAALATPAIAKLPPPSRTGLRVLPLPTPTRATPRSPRPLEGELERRVAGLFEELLAASVESADADFFALGGHSLTALRLALEVRRRFAVELPVHCVFEHSSVAELAAWIATQDQLPAGLECMVLLHHSPGGRPVFVLPPGIGSPACYADMDWPDGVTVWGAQIPGLFEPGHFDPDHAEPDRAQDIAALICEWADAIRRLQPEGPHAILGWSLGAQLGPELAAELESRGGVVDFLCLIDGGPLPSATGLRLQSATELMRAWGGVHLPARDELARWLAWCGLALPGRGSSRPRLADLRDFVEQAGRTLRVFTHNVQASAKLPARGCRAPILLLRAEQHRGRPDPLLRRVRAATSGAVERLFVPGNHMTMMLDPEYRSALSRILAGAWHNRTKVDVGVTMPTGNPEKARTGT